MDMFGLVDCSSCDFLTIFRGRKSGDPDSCYPDEYYCEEGIPCEDMKEAVQELIEKGHLYTDEGVMVEREWVLEEQKKDPTLAGHDFSSAPYWFLLCNGGVKPYRNIGDIIEDFFD